jgi:hypothetical protein
VPNTVFEHDTEAAIAKTVEYGIGEGKINFQIVVFSILNVIMLEVYLKDDIKVIKRTGLVSICDAGREKNNEDDNDDNCKTNAASPLEQIYRKHSGFVSLQNFFNAAANRQLSSSQGCLPIEIYDLIIANADFSTRKACAKVSQAFRALCQRRFSFSNSLTILNLEDSAYSAGSQNQKCSPGVDINDLAYLLSRTRMRDISYDLGSMSHPKCV